MLRVDGRKLAVVGIWPTMTSMGESKAQVRKWLKAATLASYKNEPATALAALDRYENSGCSTRCSRFLRASVLRRIHRYDECSQILVDLEPQPSTAEHIQWLAERAALLEERGDYAAAEGFRLRATKLDGDSEEGWSNVGRMNLGRLSERRFGRWAFSCVVVHNRGHVQAVPTVEGFDSCNLRSFTA